MIKNVFLRIFGDSAIIKVWDYILDVEIKVSTQDIVDGTKCNPSTIRSIMTQLHNEDIIDVIFIGKKNSVGRRTKYYILNKQNKIVVKMMDVNKEILEHQKALVKMLSK